MTSPETEYRTIHLTKGQVAIVDAADFDWLMQWKWFTKGKATTKAFYAARTLNKKYTLFMHRVILGLAPRDGILGDHINGNTLDNRRANLRRATRVQNVRNTKSSGRNTSGFKGVSRHGDKWRVYIGLDGKNVYLGLFSDPAVGYKVYCEASKRFYGEFARN